MFGNTEHDQQYDLSITIGYRRDWGRIYVTLSREVFRFEDWILLDSALQFLDGYKPSTFVIDDSMAFSLMPKALPTNDMFWSLTDVIVGLSKLAHDDVRIVWSLDDHHLMVASFTDLAQMFDIFGSSIGIQDEQAKVEDFLMRRRYLASQRGFGDVHRFLGVTAKQSMGKSSMLRRIGEALLRSGGLNPTSHHWRDLNPFTPKVDVPDFTIRMVPPPKGIPVGVMIDTGEPFYFEFDTVGQPTRTIKYTPYDLPELITITTKLDSCIDGRQAPHS